VPTSTRDAPPGQVAPGRGTAAPSTGSAGLPFAGITAPARAASGARTGDGTRTRRRFALGGRGWKRLISPVAVLVLWQLASVTGLLPAAKLSSPVQIAKTAVNLITTNSQTYGTLQGAMAVSLERVAIGFAAGAAVGVLVAVIAGLSTLGETAADPIMQMLRTLPLFGLIPLFIVWFGIGELPKVLLIALGAAIPLYLNTFSGIRGVDANLAELGRVLRLSRGELIRHIVLPGALPQALVGLRQSLGVAWLALVVAEQINANAGLGFMINQAQQFLQNNVIVVALVVYTILGLITDAIVRLIERRALAWRRDFLV
jgi:sulfonate transport system permease protein